MAESKTLGEVLNAADGYLKGKGIENARLISELLASRLLNCRRLELCLNFKTVLSEKQLAAMRRGIKRAADGEPVQYITGDTEFMGHVFKVDKRALIPRPETELLVEKVLQCELLSGKSEVHPVVVDIGTGSGCIIISIALAKPGGRYLGLDISAEAIKLAQENAAALGAGPEVAFACAELPDILDPETVDVIVANPPYIPTAEYKALPVHIRDHEPTTALDGGPDGLDVMRMIIQDSAMALKPGGFLFLEIGHQQAGAVKTLLEEAGIRHIETCKDLNGRDRIVTGRLAG